MTGEPQIERLYHDARERDPRERAAFLDQACGGDYALQREVESLLAQDSNVESFLETPALELAKKMSGEDASQSMIGRQFGPYSVASLVAKGGMGEIYRARDTKLGRDVALKLLPATFARDPERLARFQREARLLASLNHPHIAAIYGMEESGGLHGLVMELVPGETLANAGPLPLLKALPICRQIAEGLEEAHRKNITHRDIKPANIKVTPSGTVKILDFGLAKALAWEQSEVDLSELPTASGMTTEVGRILAAPSDMSPAQARVQAVDKQTDIWLIDDARDAKRFTFDPALDSRPVWSPDGKRVAFDSIRKDVYNLYWKLSSGARADELLLESDQNKAAYDWSSDGRFLLFRSQDPQTGADLWVLPVSGDKSRS